MKRQLLRSPVSLLLLIAAAAILTCRTLLLPASLVGSTSASASASAADLNATLLRLAALDGGEAAISSDVADLLGGSWARRSISSDNHHPDRDRHLPVRLRTAKDFRSAPAAPDFRPALRAWSRARRFDPRVIPQLLDLIKRPIDRSYGYPDTGRPYSSCAVVGNSGILLRSDRGELIDGHDLVIRLNNARVHGFERHVGARTSVSFVNSNILHLCARRERCSCHPYGDFVPIVLYVCQAAHLADFVSCNASHRAPLLLTDPRFDLLCARIVKYYSLRRFARESGRPPEEWATAHDDKMFHYSSGMQAVLLAAGICERVSVFGFGKSSEAKHHYHSNQKAELDLHDYEAEYEFYRDLAERPQVIPFLRDSGLEVPTVVFYHS